MTPTSEALAEEERVTEAVAAAICGTVFGPYELSEAERSEHSISGQSKLAARAAIEAYRKAVKEQG